MKKKLFCLVLLGVVFIKSPIVFAEELTGNTVVEKGEVITENTLSDSENVEETYNGAVSDLEQKKGMGILTQEQINEIKPSLINSVTVEQIKDNMTKFYLKYNVYESLEFNERITNMQNYIQGLINEKKISLDDGKKFIDQVSVSKNYEQLNEIQTSINKILTIKELPKEIKKTSENIQTKENDTKKHVKKLPKKIISHEKESSTGIVEPVQGSEQQEKDEPEFVNKETKMLPQTAGYSRASSLSLIGFLMLFSGIIFVEFRTYLKKEKVKQ